MYIVSSDVDVTETFYSGRALGALGERPDGSYGSAGSGSNACALTCSVPALHLLHSEDVRLLLLRHL